MPAYAQSPSVDPQGPPALVHHPPRVVRGGSYYIHAAGVPSAARHLESVRTDKQYNDILHTLTVFGELARETGGNMELGTTDQLLSYGAYGVDLDRTHGVIYLWLYRYRTETANQPKMVLRPRDGHWYELFKEDIERLWEDATPWQPP